MFTKSLFVFLGSREALLKERYGFRKKRSTETTCSVLIRDIREVPNNLAGARYTVFAHFKPHSILHPSALWHMWAHYGICPSC